MSFTPAGESARGHTLRPTQQPDVVSPFPSTCKQEMSGGRRSSERQPPDQLAQKGTRVRHRDSAFLESGKMNRILNFYEHRGQNKDPKRGSTKMQPQNAL